MLAMTPRHVQISSGKPLIFFHFVRDRTVTGSMFCRSKFKIFILVKFSLKT